MRSDGRAQDALREVTIECGWHRRAEGSALYRAGGTVVRCTASVEEGVKDFLRGRGQGWVTAEYLMHPRAGHRRQARDGFNGRPLSGRTQEIARLVGRALRAAVDLTALGERTLHVDCDVLEADGGTRTASVTGAMVALAIALDGMTRAGLCARPPLRTTVAAVSAGVVRGAALLDLCYQEDSAAEMDLNLVAAAEGDVVELQCTAEQGTVPRAVVEALTALAADGVARLHALQRGALASHGVELSALLRAG